MTRFLLFASAWLALLLAGPQVEAQSAFRPGPKDFLIGDWAGDYVCAQGLTRMVLRVHAVEPKVRGTYIFFEHEANPGVPSGRYAVVGDYDPATREIALEPDRWILRPSGYLMVRLDGRVDPDGERMRGRLSGAPRCGAFDLAYQPVATVQEPPCGAEKPLVQVAPESGRRAL